LKTAVSPGPLQMWGMFELSVGSLSVRKWFFPGAARFRFTLTIFCRDAWKQKFGEEAEHKREDIWRWRYQKASATSVSIVCGSGWSTWGPCLASPASSLVVCAASIPRKCAPTKSL
ncbi:hypothetical protein QBC45DRAFT_330977, partial [Copromyces sp. CBS 386.78]